MSDSQAKYHPVGRVVTRRIGADQLLVPVSGGAARENVIFPVNETGLFVWERLTAGKAVQAFFIILLGLKEYVDLNFIGLRNTGCL